MSDLDERMREYRERRKAEALDLWLRITTDLKSGMTPRQIFDSRKYTNRITGKPYTRGHIYWVVREVKRLPLSQYA